LNKSWFLKKGLLEETSPQALLDEKNKSKRNQFVHELKFIHEKVKIRFLRS